MVTFSLFNTGWRFNQPGEGNFRVIDLSNWNQYSLNKWHNSSFNIPDMFEIRKIVRNKGILFFDLDAENPQFCYTWEF